jgi:hypothetical protein
VTDLPANLADVLPVIQVDRIGGGDDVISIDHATVDVDVYAADMASAEDLAEQVRMLLRTDLPGRLVADGSAVVSRVRTITGPNRLPYDNTGLTRIGAAYQVTLHSRL